jgi:hypothetical protein
LRHLEQRASPFADLSRGPKGTHWVKPQLVAQVSFGNWTSDNLLRQPVFHGLREDKSPQGGPPRTPESGAQQSESPALTDVEVAMSLTEYRRAGRSRVGSTGRDSHASPQSSEVLWKQEACAPARRRASASDGQQVSSQTIDREEVTCPELESSAERQGLDDAPQPGE